MTKAEQPGAAADSISTEGQTPQPPSGVRGLREGLARALHLGRGESLPAKAAAGLSHAELVKQVHRLSWTATKQARVIATLEVMIDQVYHAHRRERSLAAREQREVAGDQDRFLAQLIDDYEAALAESQRERDGALARIEELQIELDASHSYCRQLESRGRPATGRETAADAETAALRRELAFAHQRLDQLTAQRSLSRDTLQRVVRQRDEAHDHISRLVRDLAELATAPPSDPANAEAEPSAAEATRPSEPPVSAPRVRPSRPPSAAGGPRSPLALALAASDPARQRRPSRPPPDASSGGRR